jgi:hypothetical protein
MLKTEYVRNRERQLAFEGNREICMTDLSSGVLSMRETSQLSTRRSNRARFVSSLC